MPTASLKGGDNSDLMCASKEALGALCAQSTQDDSLATVSEGSVVRDKVENQA
jgi:hypothetical protein